MPRGIAYEDFLIELHIMHLHSSCPPNLNEIAADLTDFVEVSVHFIVQQGEPVSNPKDEDTSRVH